MYKFAIGDILVFNNCAFVQIVFESVTVLIDVHRQILLTWTSCKIDNGALKNEKLL